MVTLAQSTFTPSPTHSSKQLRNEYVTAWLHSQTMDPAIAFDDQLDTNQIEDQLFSDSHLLNPDDIAYSSSYYHLLSQANHSSAPASRASSFYGHGHRRCLSLMNPMTSSVTPTMTITYEEQLHQHLKLRRQDYQHLYTTSTTASTAFVPEYLEQSIHPLNEQPIPYWPPQRSAEELAWERHNYYLRLQAEEEELIERLQSDRNQSRGHRTQNKTLNHIWQPRPDASFVARTGSLNRLSSPSLLSSETSRVLGLCRTSTLSAVKKIGFAKKDAISRSSRPASPLPAPSNSNNYANNSNNYTINPTAHSNIDDDSILTLGLTIHSYERATTPATTTSRTAASASSSTFFSFSPKSPSPSIMGTSSLPSKKLIKGHLGPSLKSLARRCSTRFCRSSRSNSYAGPSDVTVTEYLQGRRSLGSHPLQHKQQKLSGHLYDFKQLPAGPTGGSTEISKSSGGPQESRHRRSMTNERVPVHRTVTLFRSKSTRAPSSTKKYDDHPAPIVTVLDLPYRPHRNSLRFANGRGLDFSSTPSLTTASSASSHSSRSSVDVKGSTMSSSLLSSVAEDNKEIAPMTTTTLVEAIGVPSSTMIVSSVNPSSVLDLEEHESMRQQIVAILSLDRNDMRRRLSSRPKSRSTTPGLSQDPTEGQLEQQQHQQPLQLECLSPLAVEAQDVLPEDPQTIKEQEVAAELADPCEHIAFMLVPKTQYEFQPLIAH
ncbi:hypothetical protein EC991_007704 [Linnemannia zychae]|nr:hypothetical protein EC991_007704 [Linnemannia zychae]